MRISDWSSDVCSSDLARFAQGGEFFGRSAEDRGVAAFQAYHALPGGRRFDQHRVDRALVFRMAARPFADADHLGPGRNQREHAVANERVVEDAIGAPNQIGRASCRERVCKYGSISVVAVPLTKKKKTKNTK